MNRRQLLFSFEGRISRRTYWLRFVLPAFFLVFGALVIMPPEPNAVVPTLMIVCMWAGIPVVVKRCHDRNRPAWFLLVGLIPIVGFWWLFVEFGFFRGTIGPNKYGPDPVSRAVRKAVRARAAPWMGMRDSTPDHESG